MRHLEANIGTLREAGFSVAMTAHAYALIDSYVYGFALSEASLPINGPETVAEVAGPMMERIPAAEFPYLAEFSAGHVMRPDYDFGAEFGFGLDLILDGLEARVSRPGTAPASRRASASRACRSACSRTGSPSRT